MSQVDLLALASRKLHDKMEEQKDACVRRASPGPFEHGVQVGTFQGLEQAYQILVGLIKGDDEQP